MTSTGVAAAAVTASSTVSLGLCTTTLLPAFGVMTIADSGIPITLAEPLVQAVPCALPEPTVVIQRDVNISDNPDSNVAPGGSNSDDDDGDDADSQNQQFSDFRDPFVASTTPIIYALAACTITSWMLLIMLFVTPRSFFDGGIVYLGRKGGFSSGSSNTVTIGGRPWLQKVAALTVAISLTIATADTMRHVKEQYLWSIQNSRTLQSAVMDSMELKVTRIISSTFLWLAQAQTLIRLFPRHRERVIIKWVAFLLITLDVIFSILNSFVYAKYDVLVDRQPKTFVHPVPAMKYVFQLTLGLLYAAWVLYYSAMKRRYAFYHPLMRNICLVAIISVVSVMIPIVFFIIDLLHPKFTGWGDYVRWVGAAAASVVVWEWVERIEALEREEKKDGVLGREVFDGDDMLEVNASDFPWLRNRRSRKGGGGDSDDHGQANGWSLGAGRSRQPNGHARPPRADGADGSNWPSRPAPAATPVSRTDTPSTVYAVRYQGGSEPTRTPDILPYYQSSGTPDLERQQSVPQRQAAEDSNTSSHITQNGHARQPPTSSTTESPPAAADECADASAAAAAAHSRWRTLASSGPFFGRSSTDDHPPAEVAQHVPEMQERSRRPGRHSTRSKSTTTTRWDFKSRLEDFAARQADKIKDRAGTSVNTEHLPVTVIPAPARQGAALQQVLEEEEEIHPEDARRNSEESSIQASEDAARQAAIAAPPSTSTGTRNRRQPIPPNNPPLWPGVRPRTVTWDEDEDSYDEDEESVLEDGESVGTGNGSERERHH